MRKLFAATILAATLTGCSLKGGPGLFQPPGGGGGGGGTTTPIPFGTGQPSVPAGGGTSIPAGGTGAVPAGGTTSTGTGTSISGSTTTSGLPSSTAGKVSFLGPEPGNALVFRNLDQRSIDVKWLPTGMNRDQAAAAIIAAALGGQQIAGVTNVRMELGGNHNQWYTSGMAGTPLNLSGGVFSLATFPWQSNEVTPAIVGLVNGVITVLAWVYYEGTTSSNVPTGQSWWAAEAIGGDVSKPDFTKVKLWVRSGVLSAQAGVVGGKTMP